MALNSTVDRLDDYNRAGAFLYNDWTQLYRPGVVVRTRDGISTNGDLLQFHQYIVAVSDVGLCRGIVLLIVYFVYGTPHQSVWCIAWPIVLLLLLIWANPGYSGSSSIGATCHHNMGLFERTRICRGWWKNSDQRSLVANTKSNSTKRQCTGRLASSRLPIFARLLMNVETYK
jgi:hypothetical protein